MTGLTFSAVASPWFVTTTVVVKRCVRVIDDGPARTTTERSGGVITFVVADTAVVNSWAEVFASVPVAVPSECRLPDPVPFSVAGKLKVPLWPAARSGPETPGGQVPCNPGIGAVVTDIDASWTEAAPTMVTESESGLGLTQRAVAPPLLTTVALTPNTCPRLTAAGTLTLDTTRSAGSWTASAADGSAAARSGSPLFASVPEAEAEKTREPALVPFST